eukprot:CAMPEP_0114307820 /NCGR_PEP_ID=MMETSP0059-20121206/17695_1 /TAXON_ID=36894 /ORGANISM="Pyramimonas parkeae, Strain CCMP726" /LENGTH=100 /DNA_ID=CAMNT_0001431353 /DNA_START=315 /DNA_END=617 /DNA_ORIENTATION=-
MTYSSFRLCSMAAAYVSRFVVLVVPKPSASQGTSASSTLIWSKQPRPATSHVCTGAIASLSRSSASENGRARVCNLVAEFGDPVELAVAALIRVRPATQS